MPTSWSTMKVQRPQNSTAREYAETTLCTNALRWLGGALVVKNTSVVPLVHKLIAAGLKVVGQLALLHQAPRLYVCDGKWGHYNGGRVIPSPVVSVILKRAGTPN